MAVNLDEQFREWMKAKAEYHECDQISVAHQFGKDEISNRYTFYPRLASCLSDLENNREELEEVIRSCWALGGQFDAIRQGNFFSEWQPAAAAISKLVDDFPDEENAVAERVDQFVSDAVKLGYRTPDGGRDWAGAGLLASVFLTANFPTRFVDYRSARWKELADELDYPCFSQGAGYGEKLIWAGTFASKIVRTPTYRKYWNDSDSLWTIAGICWGGWPGDASASEPTDMEDAECFPEGTEKRRMHLYRERNQSLVNEAKRQASERDPLLHCEVCGISFQHVYGDIGREFIEAHHKVPVSQLNPETQSKVEDIALVCANCHRMLHRGEELSTVQELRDHVANRGNLKLEE